MNDRYKMVLSTRIHDWTGEPLSRVLRRIADAGWVTHPQWMQTRWKGPRRSLAGRVQSGDVADAILSLIPRNTAKARSLEVGGVEPDWALHLTLGSWLPGADRIAGIHVLALDLPAATGRASLDAVFEDVVREDIAEYGWLHEMASRERLRLATSRDPAYTGQFLPCLVWCNYLGATILDQFVPEAMTACLAPGVRTKWLTPSSDRDKGVVLVMSPTPEEAATAAGERALLAMTDCFRAMRRN